MAKKDRKVGFTPQGTYFVVTIPSKEVEVTDKVIANDKLRQSMIDEKAEEFVKEGNALTVSVVGDGCSFLKVGDKVFTAGHARLQRIELEDDENFHYVVREADVLGKVN